MKRILLATFFLFTVFPAMSQETHPLLHAFGKKLDLKEFKSLTGLKCYQSTSMQVVSKKAEIAFYLDDESAIDQVEIRPTYLEKDQYTSNPLLGITTDMEFETCYSHLENMDGTSGFSSKSYDRSISFYYSPGSSAEKFYLIVNLARDEDRVLNVERITARKAK